MAGLAKIAMEWLQDPLSWLFVASVVFVVLQRGRRGKAAPPAMARQQPRALPPGKSGGQLPSAAHVPPRPHFDI